MGNIELLKKEYYDILKNKKELCEAKIKELKAAENNDEANLEKVRLNIIDIFTTLFNTSLKKSCSVKEISEEEYYKKLGDIYLEFFNKIPAPWREKYTQAKNRDLVFEYVVEELKINTAEEIRQYFMEVYNKYK